MEHKCKCAPAASTTDAPNISSQDTDKFYPKYITIDQATKYLGLSRQIITDLLNAYNPLPYVKFPGNSRKFIIKDEADQFINKNYRGEN